VSRGHGWFIQRTVVAFLGFGRQDVADGLQQPAIAEPLHPFQRRELHGLEGTPWWTRPEQVEGLSDSAGRLRLGERVGWRRWSASLVGFAGVLIMLEPSGDFSLASIFHRQKTVSMVPPETVPQGIN